MLFRKLFARVRGGARRILGDAERLSLLETGVRFVLLSADERITDAELDDLKRRSDHAITAARTAAEAL